MHSIVELLKLPRLQSYGAGCNYFWDNKYSIKMRTETLAVARKYANLIKKSFRIKS